MVGNHILILRHRQSHRPTGIDSRSSLGSDNHETTLNYTPAVSGARPNT